jgi:hypothetical protein
LVVDVWNDVLVDMAPEVSTTERNMADEFSFTSAMHGNLGFDARLQYLGV